MDRLEITITGPLPEEDKYAILAAADSAAKALARELSAAHGIDLKATVGPVRVSGPRKSGAVAAHAGPAPVVEAVAPRFNMDTAE